MLEACSAEQIERWIKPLMTGARHECYAITEAEAGSDVDAIKSTTRRAGDHYILNGEKWHVTSANLSDYMFFQAKIADGPNAGSHALFSVDHGTPGVEVVRTPAYTHNYRAHHPIYRFTDVRVPAANRIGKEGDGMAFTYAWFRHERLMIAARCCGAAERLIDETTAFAKERVQLGQPIIGFQAIAQLSKAEVPGPTADKLVPRIRETAQRLYVVYSFISASMVLMLLFGGMSLFDSLTHMFGAMGTGGFSPKNASVGYYKSVYIDLVISAFMFIAGANFSLHYFVMVRGDFKSLVNDEEFRFYSGVVGFFALTVAQNLVINNVYGEFLVALRHALFSVVSIITTTGYATEDFEKWPAY